MIRYFQMLTLAACLRIRPRCHFEDSFFLLYFKWAKHLVSKLYGLWFAISRKKMRRSIDWKLFVLRRN